MLIESKKSIRQVIYVVGYARDLTIRTKQFDIEKALAPLISGPSVNTNLPDEHNPHAPRVQIGRGKISAQFTQLAAQFTIAIENANEKPLEIIQDSIVKKINLFQSCLDRIVSRNQQRERGLVLVIQYPVDSARFPDEVVSQYLQTNFFRFSPLGAPVNSGFNVGYRTEDNFFLTLTVGQYKMIGGELPIRPTANWIDLTQLPVIESGLELKVDVNSRPLITVADQPNDVTAIILTKAFGFVMQNADDFMGIKK